MVPSCGTSRNLSIFYKSLISLTFGESPPCTQKILSSTTAVMVRQSKIQVKERQTLREPYLRMHSSQKPYTCVMSLDSWLPLSRVILFLYLTLRASSMRKVSMLSLPRSTQSPRKIQLAQGGYPPILKSSSRSSNCPWMSPQMVTGDLTLTVFGSVFKISLASSHSFWMEVSWIFSRFLSCSIIYSASLREPIKSIKYFQKQSSMGLCQCHRKEIYHLGSLG